VNAIARDEWYRLTMRVDIVGDNMTVEGKLFRHLALTDPNSGILPCGSAGRDAPTLRPGGTALRIP